jgi:hypothetical protein
MLIEKRCMGEIERRRDAATGYFKRGHEPKRGKYSLKVTRSATAIPQTTTHGTMRKRYINRN